MNIKVVINAYWRLQWLGMGIDACTWVLMVYMVKVSSLHGQCVVTAHCSCPLTAQCLPLFARRSMLNPHCLQFIQRHSQAVYVSWTSIIQHAYTRGLRVHTRYARRATAWGNAGERGGVQGSWTPIASLSGKWESRADQMPYQDASVCVQRRPDHFAIVSVGKTWRGCRCLNV